MRSKSAIVFSGLLIGLLMSIQTLASEKNPIFSVGSQDVKKAKEILDADPKAANARTKMARRHYTIWPEYGRTTLL